MSRAASVLLAFSSLALSSTAAPEPSLQPFVLPWNDVSSGPTDLSGWSDRPAGAQGFVEVDPSGHFAIAGKRIRFLGVNITSQSCFPIEAHADLAAARLAHFGVNSVRFHHMDAPWNAVPLIHYGIGHSRALNPVAFERLHHFVQALKKQGIYSNINLLVSRRFSAADGLPPEVERLSWKDQHILGFFDPHALSLQQEYARQLLATAGPNGEPPLVQEPAVAFVEILNENGIIQKWYEGVLDTLPAPFLDELTERWTIWLRTQYSTTNALRQSWRASSEIRGAVMIPSQLEAEGRGWKLVPSPEATVEITSSRDDVHGAILRLAVTRFDPSEWSQARLQSGPVRLVSGKLYTLSFEGKTDSATGVYAQLSDTKGKLWQNILAARLGRTWTKHRITFVAPATEEPVRINLGGFNQPGAFELAELTLHEGGELLGLPPSASLESGQISTIPILATEAATASIEAQRDWLHFLTDLEVSYWKTMSNYVKETLGFRGIVFGTIISNSPVGVQSQLASVDGHNYWQHPRFPAGEWDQKNWHVSPQTMVANPSASTIAALSGQRVKGRPFTATEYQHSSPNPYSAEGPVFAGAYAALQDWDGVWFFEYVVPPSANAVKPYEGKLSGFFDDSQHPGRMVNYLLAAALFRRGDLMPAKEEMTVAFPKDRELELLRTHGSAWRMPDASAVGLSGLWSLHHRVSLDPTTSQTFSETARPDEPGPSGIHRSDTDQLIWDAADRSSAVLRIKTPKTRAILGFVANHRFELGDVAVTVADVSDRWATLGLTLIEGDFGTRNGAKGLIIATARIVNTHQDWTDERRTSLGANWGDAPTLIETVRAQIELPVSAKRLTVFALDERGQRTTAVPVEARGEQALLSLGGEQAPTTLWYEFVIAPEQ